MCGLSGRAFSSVILEEFPVKVVPTRSLGDGFVENSTGDQASGHWRIQRELGDPAPPIFECL